MVKRGRKGGVGEDIETGINVTVWMNKLHEGKRGKWGKSMGRRGFAIERRKWH